mgnify:CR=1 FL=1
MTGLEIRFDLCEEARSRIAEHLAQAGHRLAMREALHDEQRLDDLLRLAGGLLLTPFALIALALLTHLVGCGGGGASGTVITQTGSQIPNLDPVMTSSYQYSHRTSPQSNTILTGTTSLVTDPLVLVTTTTYGPALDGWALLITNLSVVPPTTAFVPP